MLKTKDLFTLGSLFVSLYSISVAFEGRLERAAVFVLLAWAFDAADGLVARLTRSGNAFGANLDDLVDHFAYTVAPAFVLFNAWLPYGRLLAFTLLFGVIAVGTIRLARSATWPVSYPGYWLGLPRPALGFMIVFFLNSSLRRLPGGPVVGTVLVAIMAAMCLTYLPYRNHKRPFRLWQKTALVATAIACIAMYPLGQMWNGALLLGTIYLFAPWIALDASGRAEIARAVDAQIRHV